MNTTDIQTTANADGYTLTVFAGGRCVHKTTARVTVDGGRPVIDEEADDYNRAELSPDMETIICMMEELSADAVEVLRSEG